MKNYHQPTTIITVEEIVIIEHKLREAWTQRTTFPKFQHQWSHANKAHGQCVVTALLIHDLFGGDFAEDKRLDHVWNILPDRSEHDFSREQFSINTQIIMTNKPLRSELLESPGAIKSNTYNRYQLLKQTYEA